MTREKALESARRLLDKPPGGRRKRAAQRLLESYPHLADAWVALAEECEGTDAEALGFLEKAVQAGAADLGPEFLRKNDGRLAHFPEAVPYLRAHFEWGQALWAQGALDLATRQFETCLALDTEDALGVRDILVGCYLRQGTLEKARLLLMRYPDEAAAWAYNQALYLYKKEGPARERAVRAAREATQRNPFVPSYLFGLHEMPATLPPGYALGSEEEAQIYCHALLPTWLETLGAREWLAECLD